MRRLIISVLLLLVSITGLLRLGFDTDILAMLPGEVPEVHGLTAYRDVLERGGALIVSLECGEEDAGLLPEEVESLAMHLRKSGVVGEALWRPVFEEDPEGLGELIAYLWLNGDEAQWELLLERLNEDGSKAVFDQSIQRLGTMMDMTSVKMSAVDPMGFLKHSGMKAFESEDSEEGGFESENGMLHLMFVRPPESVHGYKETRQWIDRVKGEAREWQQGGERDWLKVAYTGGPVFTTEVGDGMEKDVRGTVGVTLLLVSLLFWWMQRRIWLLVALAGMLVLIFSLTLGIASLIYGELSMMSVGFASILIGLAVDYGMVVCQEERVSAKDEKALRLAVTKGIVWAALTTSAVFAALCLSSLPGIRQLGVLVAIGILSGAVVILVLYVPIVSRVSVARLGKRKAVRADGVPVGAYFLPPSLASWLLVVVLAFSGTVLAWKSLPKITFDFSVMQPSVSPGMDAMARIKHHMPAWNSLGIHVVVEANDDEEMLNRLRLLEKRAVNSEEAEDIIRASVPSELWPDHSKQENNRDHMLRLLDERDRLNREAREAGYTDKGMVLTRAVFNAMEQFSTRKGIVYPANQAAGEILQSYLWRDSEGGGLARARVVTEVAAKPDKKNLEDLRKLNGDGAYVSGWALLSPAVLPLIYRDVTHIFVPMAVILLVMLLIVFRDWRDVLLVSGCLAAPMLMVMAGMRLMNRDWDMLNIVTIPLLLGMGMDYGIHMVMALRRHAHAPSKVWHGIGKALIFCGISTAIGFGSLGLASNVALAGMGMLCSVGILLTMTCTVFVMPGVWRWFHRDAIRQIK